MEFGFDWFVHENIDHKQSFPWLIFMLSIPLVVVLLAPETATVGHRQAEDEMKTSESWYFARRGHGQPLLSRGTILTVAERARALIIELRYGLPWYLAR